MEKLQTIISANQEVIVNVTEVKKQMNALKFSDRLQLAWKLIWGKL